MQPVAKAMAAGVPEKTERGLPHGKEDNPCMWFLRGTTGRQYIRITEP